MTKNPQCLEVVTCNCLGCSNHKLCRKTINLKNDAYFSRQVAFGQNGQELKKPYRVNYCFLCSEAKLR